MGYYFGLGKKKAHANNIKYYFSSDFCRRCPAHRSHTLQSWNRDKGKTTDWIKFVKIHTTHGFILYVCAFFYFKCQCFFIIQRMFFFTTIENLCLSFCQRFFFRPCLFCFEKNKSYELSYRAVEFAVFEQTNGKKQANQQLLSAVGNHLRTLVSFVSTKWYRLVT